MQQKKFGAVFLSIAAIVVSVSAFGIYKLWQSGHNGGPSGLELDPNATIGIMPGVDLDARRAELQQMLDNSQIAFSVNTSPAIDPVTGEGNLMLENPQNNAKLLTAELVLDSSQEIIYASKALPPGSYLEKIKLEKKLPSGKHNATVYLKAYDLETQSIVGQTGAAISITVP